MYEAYTPTNKMSRHHVWIKKPSHCNMQTQVTTQQQTVGKRLECFRAQQLFSSHCFLNLVWELWCLTSWPRIFISGTYSNTYSLVRKCSAVRRLNQLTGFQSWLIDCICCAIGQKKTFAAILCQMKSHYLHRRHFGHWKHNICRE